jgi:hypothetical protein
MFSIILLQADVTGVLDILNSLLGYGIANLPGIVSMTIVYFVVRGLWRWSKGVAEGGPRGLLVAGLGILLFIGSFVTVQYAVNRFPTISVGFTNSAVDGLNKMPTPILPGTPVPDSQEPDDQPDDVRIMYALSKDATLRDGPSGASNYIDTIPVNTVVCVLKFVPGDNYCEDGYCRRAQVSSLPNLYSFPTGFIHESTLGAQQGPCP